MELDESRMMQLLYLHYNRVTAVIRFSRVFYLFCEKVRSRFQI